MFDVKAAACAILMCGMLISNLTVSLTAATYIHDLDSSMLALFLSALAAYQWNKQRRISLLAVFCIAGSLGIYQAYISVCIVLIIMRCIIDALCGKTFLQIIKKGIIACMTLLSGALLYVMLLYLVRHFSGISMETGTANSLHNMDVHNIGSLWSAAMASYENLRVQLYYGWKSIFPTCFFKAAHILVVICLAGSMSRLFFNSKHKVPLQNIILCVLLTVLIPPAIFFAVILSGGQSLHLLMLYSLWLIYILILLLLYQLPTKNNMRFTYLPRIIVAAVFSILVWGNIRTANSIYLVKELQNEAASSLMTRILYRMEDTDEYVTGQTPVAFIGSSNLLSNIPNTARYELLTGVHANLLKRDVPASYDPIYKLAAYNLASPLIICDDTTYLSLYSHPDVRKMPCYPADGCMKLIDDVFVVKLGN